MTGKQLDNNDGLAALAVLVTVLGAAVAPPAVAQDSEKLTVEVNDCLAIEKRDERLACFDAQVEAARRRSPSEGAPAEPNRPAPPAAAAPPPPPAPAGRSAAAPAPAAPTRNAESGARTAPPAAEAEAPREGRRSRSGDDFGRKVQAQEAEQEIVATVTDLRETVPNSYVITLDNGQVWRQSVPQRYPLRKGLEVRLRETKFGYRLTAPQYRGQIPVERVR
jgi:hypothetical protein